MVARKAGTDGAMVNDMALGVFSTVARRDTASVEAGSVAGALSVDSAPHADRWFHCYVKGKTS